MMILLRYIGRFFGGTFRFLGRYKSLLPVGFAGIFIVSTFFYNWIVSSLPHAFSVMAKKIFASELVINENVHLAVENSASYNFWAFISILISLYILFALVRFFVMVQVKISGAQAVGSSYIVALGIVGIISISAIAVIDGSFGFIPIYHSIIFLLMNLGPVISNIFSSGVVTTAPIIIENVTNSSF